MDERAVGLMFNPLLGSVGVFNSYLALKLLNMPECPIAAEGPFQVYDGNLTIKFSFK